MAHRRGGWLLGRDGTKPGWYGSWQNLNEGPDGNPKGPATYHGRVYVHPTGSESTTLRATWRLGGDAGPRLSLLADSGEGEVMLSLGVGVASLYLAAEARPIREALRALGMFSRRGALLHGVERELGVSFHDASIWWRLWSDPNEWREGTPRWREGSLDLDRLLRGAATITRRELERGEVFVPMPEGSYAASAVLEEVRVERPRWPAEISYTVTLDLGGRGIPVPGKGESSWDIDDDAILQSSIATRSVAEAVGELVGSVLARRARHGGKNWSPSPIPPAVNRDPSPAPAVAAA